MLLPETDTRYGSTVMKMLELPKLQNKQQEIEIKLVYDEEDGTPALQSACING
jgi:hypothetical protein